MVVKIIEWIFWGLIAIPVAYQLLFAICSLLPSRHVVSPKVQNKRILVLFPSYKEDVVIEQSVTSFLEQDYPNELFSVVVIADKFEKETVERLKRLPIKVLDVDFENSSKATALKYAFLQEPELFDIVVIFDSDNLVEPSFLQDVAEAYSNGNKAIQAHRKAKNLDTDIAVLDALSEELSNSVLRKGHNAAGLSSALIGSGMAFDYEWLKENVRHLSSAGEDKELEKLLLKQRVFIKYLPNTFVLDEKVQSSKGFYSQRRRWIAAQFYSMIESVKDFPSALLHWNIDYCDKLLQWMMLPRVLMMGLMGFLLILSFFIPGMHFLKWCVLLASLIVAFAIATPLYLYEKGLFKAFLKLPLIFVMMFLNLFRIKGSRNKFYHTEHNV